MHYVAVMAHGIQQEDIVLVIMVGVGKTVQYHWLCYVSMVYGITVIEDVPVIVVGLEVIVRKHKKKQEQIVVVAMAHGIILVDIVGVIVVGMETIVLICVSMVLEAIWSVPVIQAGQGKAAMFPNPNIVKMAFGTHKRNIVSVSLDIPENIAIGLPNKFK